MGGIGETRCPGERATVTAAVVGSRWLFGGWAEEEAILDVWLASVLFLVFFCIYSSVGKGSFGERAKGWQLTDDTAVLH